MSELQKKRHHYVPVAYLARFADSAGRLYAYPEDEPDRVLHLRPREIAFEKYYYSQPLPDGGQDNNRLEDLFSAVETWWPGLVEDLTAGRDVRDRMEALYQFMGLLRVRVPAARDPVELHLAHMARRTMLRMAAAGEIPPPPPSIGSFDNVEISIDPHQSIHAMAVMMQGFAKLLGFIGFEIVHNTSSEAFITSDNPVMVVDPDVPEDRVLPYTVRPPERRVELLLPISPKVLVRGCSDLWPMIVGEPLRHVEMSAAAEVRRVNRFAARFGYRFVFADRGGLTTFLEKYAAASPTPRFDTLPDGQGGEYNFTQMVFGPRPEKPKWTRKTGEASR
jgi:hypothetical protein